MAIVVGDKVVFTNEEKHLEAPQFYPAAGTRGVVKSVGDIDAYVQWEHGSTTNNDCWYCDLADIVPLEEYPFAEDCYVTTDFERLAL